MTPKFFYVFDALCSWCYAFYPQLTKSLDAYPDYDLQLVSGGMFIGSGRRKALELVNPSQVTEMYKPLKEYGKANISDAYIQDLVLTQNYYLDSERPAVGLCVFREYRNDPRIQLNFVHDIQTQMYAYGVNPNSDAYFTNVLGNYNIESAEFLHKLTEDQYHILAEEDFALARALGVDAYPQLIYQTANEDYYLIAKGFTHAEDIISRVAKINEETKS